MKAKTTTTKATETFEKDENALVITGKVTRILAETEKFISFTIASQMSEKITNYIMVKAFSSDIPHPEQGDRVKVLGYVASGAYESKDGKKVYETYISAHEISEVK